MKNFLKILALGSVLFNAAHGVEKQINDLQGEETILAAIEEKRKLLKMSNEEIDLTKSKALRDLSFARDGEIIEALLAKIPNPIRREILLAELCSSTSMTNDMLKNDGMPEIIFSRTSKDDILAALSIKNPLFNDQEHFNKKFKYNGNANQENFDNLIKSLEGVCSTNYCKLIYLAAFHEIVKTYKGKIYISRIIESDQTPRVFQIQLTKKIIYHKTYSLQQSSSLS